MKIPRRFFRMVVSLGLVLILAGAIQIPKAAWASMEDAAIFYEELAEHGDWVDYENYGPVWYPKQVQENWRPYVDGRWMPSDQGYVFETQEPWGWATYHYGNWMPTDAYGWVWVPGRTWYPSTVTWRQSPESDSPNASYLGWAPIPPENYVPTQGYYPPGYSGGAPYRGPVENLITAPFWIFVRAASFLLGFGQPYAPNYSYWNSAALIPPTYVPYYYGRTVVINNYYTPSYYPTGFLSAGRGYYNYGPPIPYVARVTRVNQVTINNYVRNVNIYKFRNVAPPERVLARRAYFQNVVPPAMVQRQPLGRAVRAQNMRMARANLARPNVVNANVIQNAPTFQKLNVKIPKAQVTQVQPGRGFRGARNVPGAALPASAMMQPTKQMQKNIRKVSPTRQIVPVSPTARNWNVPQTPGAAAIQPAAVQQPSAVGTPGMAAPGTVPKKRRPGAMGVVPQTTQPGTTGTPQAVSPGQAPGKRGVRALQPSSPQATTQGQTPFQPKKRRTATSVTPGTSTVAKPGETPSQGRLQKKSPWSKQGLAPGETTQQPQRMGIQQQQRQRFQPKPQVQQQQRYQPKTQVQQQQRVQPKPRVQQQQQFQPKRQIQQRRPPQQQQEQQKKKYTPPGQPQSFRPGGSRMTGYQPSQRQFQPQTRTQSRQQVQKQQRFQQQQVRQQPREQQRTQVRQQPRTQSKSQSQTQSNQRRQFNVDQQ